VAKLWSILCNVSFKAVFTACQALHKLDVKVVVDAYADSLRKTLRGYANSGDAQLVIMQSGIGQLMASFLQGTVSISSMSNSSALSVLLLHAGDR
jgi:gamma-glutamylcysteine synthetase